jgi:hypothetical protein
MLHLLCEAHARADGPLRDDVRTLLGWNVPREEVLAGEHVSDRWSVLARVIVEQERLRVARTWLWGVERERPALLLDFAPPGAPLAPQPPAGSAVRADVAFYPGATPLRALMVGEPAGLETAPGSFARGGAEAALATAAEAMAHNPWLDEWPVALRAAAADERTLVAEDGTLALGGPERTRRRLLAASGGHPVSVFGLWNGEVLAPLAAGDGARTVPL